MHEYTVAKKIWAECGSLRPKEIQSSSDTEGLDRLYKTVGRLIRQRNGAGFAPGIDLPSEGSAEWEFAKLALDAAKVSETDTTDNGVPSPTKAALVSIDAKTRAPLISTSEEREVLNWTKAEPDGPALVFEDRNNTDGPLVGLFVSDQDPEAGKPWFVSTVSGTGLYLSTWLNRYRAVPKFGWAFILGVVSIGLFLWATVQASQTGTVIAEALQSIDPQESPNSPLSSALVNSVQEFWIKESNAELCGDRGIFKTECGPISTDWFVETGQTTSAGTSRPAGVFLQETAWESFREFKPGAAEKPTNYDEQLKLLTAAIGVLLPQCPEIIKSQAREEASTAASPAIQFCQKAWNEAVLSAKDDTDLTFADGGVVSLQLPMALMMLSFATLCAALGFATVGEWSGILINARNRVSLGMTQLIAWTIVVLGAWMTIAVFQASLLSGYLRRAQTFALEDAARGNEILANLNTFPTIDPALAAALGIVGLSPLASGAILSKKKPTIIDGVEQTLTVSTKPLGLFNAPTSGLMPKPAPSYASVVDLFLGEEKSNAERVDPSRVQQVIITVSLLFTYAVMLFSSVNFLTMFDFFNMHSNQVALYASLPPVSATFAGLLAFSHGAYLIAKTASKPPEDTQSGAI